MHEIIICHIHIKLRQGQNDLATFIDAMKLTHDFTGPWIAFGGSYPGSMAAWVREKYPHLIQGSVSSSGPLLAKVKFLLGKSMRNSKSMCRIYSKRNLRFCYSRSTSLSTYKSYMKLWDGMDLSAMMQLLKE